MVKLVIASDSGNSNDLNQAYVREKVNRHASLIPDPPFIPDPDWSDNDVFIPVDGYSCVSPPDDSHHWSNSKLRMNNLTPGSFTVDQTWQWECRRCSAGNWHNNTHYIITRTVAGTNGNWTITIDQSGVHSGAYNIVP